MTNDLTWWLYLNNFITATIGFIAFGWWWKKMGDATKMYTYITFLFGVIAFQEWMNFIARTLKFTNDNDYHAFMTSWVWSFREILVAIVLSIIVGQILKRIVLKHNGS